VSESDLDLRIERLYALPLPDFTEARNALAKDIRSSGDRESADRVKALKKPPVTAWAVNQVIHHYPGVWTDLLESSDAVRAAHASGPERLGEAVAARKAALSGARETAEGILYRAGHTSSGPQSRRVSGTLEALAAGATSVAPGRLVADLEPPGFGGLAGLEFAAVVRPVTPSAGAGKTRSTGVARPRAGGTPTSAKPAAEPRAAPAASDRQAAVLRKKVERAVSAAEAALAKITSAAEEARLARSVGERQHGDSALASAAANERLREAQRAAAEATKAEAGLAARLKKLHTAEQRAERALADGGAHLDEARRALEEV